MIEQIAQPRVALAACGGYGATEVEGALRRLLAPLGGMAAFVRPGQRVALKPNLLRPTTPDGAATTHPAIVTAVARLVREADGEPCIVDSPGGPSTGAYVRTVLRMTGMARAAADSGATLVDELTAVQVAYPEGLLLKRVDLLQAAVEADVLINLPKLKTHGLAGLTVAVKNLFGLVPGVVKVGYHSRLRDRRDFCRGLVDVALAAGAALHIVDGVTGMEGDGPSAGHPRHVGALLAGADPLAVDVVAAALVGLEPHIVGTTEVATQAGLTTGRLEDVDLVGEPLARLRLAEPFRLPASIRSSAVPTGPAPSAGWRAAWRRFLTRQLLLTPRAGPGCTACGFCARHCPVDAIQMDDGRARMDPGACIRCYCCHELCPQLAVELHRPWLGRLLAR